MTQQSVAELQLTAKEFPQRSPMVCVEVSAHVFPFHDRAWEPMTFLPVHRPTARQLVLEAHVMLVSPSNSAPCGWGAWITAHRTPFQPRSWLRWRRDSPGRAVDQ
jgi:hypothetical protein